MKKLFNYNFYNYKDIYPFLEVLKDNKIEIKNEVDNILKEKWNIWPEENLYTKGGEWKIFPFYGFDIWIEHNCKKCPVIFDILKNIPGLKTALLSKLKPNTTLDKHRGWANLSNYVLRCQYGINVNSKCFLGCNEEIVKMEEDMIVVFDDSEWHYAENKGDCDRIVLILDIERPSYVKLGESDIEETPELFDFINEIKNN